MNTLLIFGLLLTLMLTGMPVSIALGLTVLTGLCTMTTVPIEEVVIKLFTGTGKFEVLAIPLFILAGNFIFHGGVARRMIAFAASLVGHYPGGLGLTAVLACPLFGAVSGASPATVVAIGSILGPAMDQQGLPRCFGSGTIAAAVGPGMLIPPSLLMVLYGVTTNSSVGALLVAALIPGLLLASMLGATTWWISRRHQYPGLSRADWGTRWRTFRQSVWGLLLIVLVAVGLYTGLFTLTEAGAVSAVYAFLVAVLIHKELPLQRVPRVLLESANRSAMLLYLLAIGFLFADLLTCENIQLQLAQWMVVTGLGQVGFLLAVNLLLFLAGTVLAPTAVILIVAPVLFPMAVVLGVDPIHFGVMIIASLGIGMLGPMVRLDHCVASGISPVGMTGTTIDRLPWLFTLLLFVMMVTCWPTLSLWLPRTQGML